MFFLLKKVSRTWRLKTPLKLKETLRPKIFFHNSSEWEKLPQELKIPRGYFVAFFVSDDLVECSSKSDNSDDGKYLQMKNDDKIWKAVAIADGYWTQLLLSNMWE